MNNDCIKLGSEIIANDNYDIIAKTKNTEEIINIANAVCNENRITSIVDENGEIYLREDIEVYNKILFIPGIGYLTPGTRVIYKNKDYQLCYGWHTNISDQTLISWYLEPLETDEPMKTLYKEMINEIELVHFR